MLSAGPDALDRLDHRRLLDVAEALILRPLADHPAELEKFRDETLYAPLSGTVEARRRAQNEALASVGLDLDKVAEIVRKRKAAEEAAAREEAAKAAAATPPPPPQDGLVEGLAR